MVVYNDTQFLSYQLLSLPYIFADILSAPGRPGNSMIFIDQVNLLYSLGKESLLSEIVRSANLEIAQSIHQFQICREHTCNSRFARMLDSPSVHQRNHQIHIQYL